MDYTLITRVESHAQDLFKLGQEDNSDTSTAKKHKKLGPLLAIAQREEQARHEEPAIPKSKSVPFKLSELSALEEEEEEEQIKSPAPSPPPSSGRKSPRPTPPPPTISKDDIFHSWISMRRLPLEEQQKIHYEDLFGCFTRNFGKGFALGFAGKTILNIFQELVLMLRFRKIDIQKLAQTLDGSKEHGLFLALLLASHNSVMYVTKDLKHQYARYRGALSGFISGLISLFFLPISMRRAVILFTCVRSFELFCRMMVRRKRLPNIENGDTALMSLASSIMIFIWCFFPKALDPSYQHFLNRQVQVPTPIVRGIAAMQSGKPLENLNEINAARQALVKGQKQLAKITDPFSYDSPLLSAAEKAAIILHPHQSFQAFTLNYFLKAIRNAAPVYIPVYAVPLVMFSRKRLIRSPVSTIKTAAIGATRSTIFLATYCTLGIATLSLGRRFGWRYDQVGIFAMGLPLFAGALAGSATIIEKKQRRIELALYVLSKAVEGFHNVLKEKLGERIVSPMFGDSIFFAICFSVVCHANLRHPELLRDSYRGLLLRFFDTEERHKFF